MSSEGLNEELEAQADETSGQRRELRVQQEELLQSIHQEVGRRQPIYGRKNDLFEEAVIYRLQQKAEALELIRGTNQNFWPICRTS